MALSAYGAQRRCSACAATAPVRVGLLINGKAGRQHGARATHRLTNSLDGPDAWEQTPDLASVRRAIAQLLVVRAANVLVIAGGDGTLHHAVNALLALTEETHAASGILPPMPRILLLNGGTLNIVGRTVGIHGPPSRTLQRFLHDFQGAPLSRVPGRRLSLLQVRAGTEPCRYGFVFGSEVTYHALELYERFGAGYLGLSRFLLALSSGIALGSALWQREGWKLGPYTTGLNVDGLEMPPYIGAVASTVDLTLAVAAIRAIRRPMLAKGFAVRVVDQASPKQLVAMLPALLREGSANGVHDWPSVQSLTLSGPYSLDGERFSQPALSASQQPLSVTLSPHRLFAVPGLWGTQRP